MTGKNQWQPFASDCRAFERCCMSARQIKRASATMIELCNLSERRPCRPDPSHATRCRCQRTRGLPAFRLRMPRPPTWTTAVGPDSNALTYMLVWESLADREAKWGKFVVDPEWVEVRKASEAAGPIVAKMDNSFLAPTSFSSAK
ncbi:NIPSNAP family protein [Variovorax sp. LT1R20]|uniref:NIPSNAP family protein n=1 Tax=Variovorax sp. LT1R20 TaxID=3443729 RepID=UPI003F445D99